MNLRIEYIKIALVALLVVGLLPLAITPASACGFDGCEDARTPGYWKNHPDAWPVEEIEIGGEIYSKEEAIEIMQDSGEGDKTYTMFRALAAAKLNLENGCNDCIAEVVEDADDWMVENGPVGSDVRGSSDAWQENGEMLYHMLDDYNNGEACP